MTKPSGTSFLLRCKSVLAREFGVERLAAFAKKLAPKGALLLVLCPAAVADELDTTSREALSAAYYAFEVAGYCGLVSDAVAAGFRRRVGRILADADIDRETLNTLRGKAWQAAHWEWQNRGLGGFRGWCRNEGRSAAQGFLAEPD